MIYFDNIDLGTLSKPHKVFPRILDFTSESQINKMIMEDMLPKQSGQGEPAWGAAMVCQYYLNYFTIPPVFCKHPSCFLVSEIKKKKFILYRPGGAMIHATWHVKQGSQAHRTRGVPVRKLTTRTVETE
jgi:hypothetical protein